MAITYAWRLDANKYAYIIDPDTGEYGFASKTPVTGNRLEIIANTAKELFECEPYYQNGKLVECTKEDKEEKRSLYIEAFNAMQTKVLKELGSFDMLSPDVYFDVDSTSCSDLRGVGIKGFNFLGTADSWDFKNPHWNSQGDIKKSGTFLVYGVYMNDQVDNNGNVDTNATPESFFVVKNGVNGTDANGNLGTAELEDRIKAEEDRSIDADNEMSRDISELKQKVNALSSISGGDLSQLFNTVTSLSTQVTALQNENTQLKNRLTVVEQWIASNEEGGNGNDVNNPTEGVGFGGLEANDIGTYYMVVCDEGNNLYKTSKINSIVKYNDGKLVSDNGFYES